MGGFAWVTLATNDSYSLGALVLAHSLRRVNTAHQLVVLITPGVTEAMKTQLSAVFNVVKLVDVLDSGDADNLALLARPELGITFTKLHCWKLTQYDKCVFLDADTLVLQNSDELFEREELSAAPDAGWPDCFNSGVFVYNPSIDTFNKLIEFALVHGSFDGGDQGLLNLFFSDWATKDIKKHLPFVYNMVSTSTYSYLPAFKQFGQGLKIIHFIGIAKPWLQPFNTETGLVQTRGDSPHVVQFVQLWWDLFCTHIHPSLSTEMAGLAGALASVKLGAPLSAEQAALEEHLRRQGWEQGNIDYMGKDSFSNIWQKICDTLASTRITPVETPAPVAPIAAPTYVSSVEISPSGPIDTSPPANYAPVSSSKPTTVVASVIEAVSNEAASAETTIVVPETKSPSVTELGSTPATPAALDSSVKSQAPPSEANSETSIPLTPITPVDSIKTDAASASLLASVASVEPLDPKVQSLNTIVSECQPPIVSSPEVQASTTAVEKVQSQVSAPGTDITKVTDGPTQIQSVQAPIPLPVMPTATLVQTPVPQTSTQTETLVQTSIPLTSSPKTKIPDPSPSTPTETPIQTPIPLPSTPTTVSVPTTPAESPVSTTPLPTKLSTESPATQVVSQVPDSPKESAPPTPVKTADLPLTPISTPSSPQSTPTETPIKTPAQPQTPTVTEPTPPTSPPIGAVESPLATKLQVDADVPATPPVGGSSSQPVLSNVPSDEPPVPPKRKGGSKATQEAKGHKGKPAKGKK